MILHHSLNGKQIDGAQLSNEWMTQWQQSPNYPKPSEYAGMERRNVQCISMFL
jgi:hypothetical protein